MDLRLRGDDNCSVSVPWFFNRLLRGDDNCSVSAPRIFNRLKMMDAGMNIDRDDEEPLAIVRLESSTHPDFEKYYEIYDSSFPADEKVWREIIVKRLDDGRYIIYVAKAGGEVVGFCSFWELADERHVLLDYLATKQSRRGRGVARRILEFIPRIERFSGKDFLLEVEDPCRGANREERLKRVEFYRSAGVLTFDGVQYTCPPLQGPNPTEMILMTLPREPKASITREEATAIVVTLYTKLYRRAPDDPYLAKIIESIPETVFLV